MEGKAEAPPKMASTTDTMKQKDESRDRDQVSSYKLKMLPSKKPKQDLNIAGKVKDVKILAATSAWKDLVPWSQAKKGNQW
ncbi:hypothetical protein OIU79_005580 [Salix purpurea]|uniref:Uncharacterized protein n=1 Tax=Salix purpurea TaxID=77065 RepID=A0A9Q0TT94_SALPP|nr:hypothetical protein OIU79_005580 [Salix purpurea]